MTIGFRAPFRRHSLLFRCSALGWAVVFLLSGVRDAIAHVECAHHTAAAEHAGAEPAGEHPHAGHGVQQRGAADPESPGHPCTCVGPCQAAGATPLPNQGWVAVAPEVVVRTGAPLPVAGDPLPGPSPYLLPYPNAPPLRG